MNSTDKQNDLVSKHPVAWACSPRTLPKRSGGVAGCKPTLLGARVAALLRPSYVLAALAVVIWASPTLTRLLQLQLDAGSPSSAWQFLTWHWTHWSLEHLVWDVLAFAVLARTCEALDRRALWLCIPLSAITVSLAVCLRHPEIGAFRGLSGLDSALFGLAAVGMIRRGREDRVPMQIWLAAAGLAGFAGKIAWELATGGALFADNTPMIVLPVAHLAGVVTGIAVAIGAPQLSKLEAAVPGGSTSTPCTAGDRRLQFGIDQRRDPR